MSKTTTLNEDYAFVRRALGLKQVDFSRLIGCSVQIIGKIEKGDTITRDIMCKTYVEFLNIMNLAKNNEIALKDEEIYIVDKFCNRLIGEINKSSTDPRQIIKR